MVGEALECLGGNGYVEESILPRLYREAPLNSIWEGSGNVMCLDVLRAIPREPQSLERSSPSCEPSKAPTPNTTACSLESKINSAARKMRNCAPGRSSRTLLWD